MPTKETELQLFARITTENGGEWWELEANAKAGYAIYMSKTKIETKGKSFYLSPVYQVFDTKTGRRVYASTDQNAARSEYRWYCNHVTF